MQRKPHGSDLRRGRVSLAGQSYLVTTVTNGRKPIFNDFRVGRVVVREIMRTEIFEQTHTLAFVVMPDHVHWLFTLAANASLSGVIGDVKKHSARQVNDLLGKRGSPVWQRGFHDHALRSEESVWQVAGYLIATPLGAGWVCGVGDYPLWVVAWLYFGGDLAVFCGGGVIGLGRSRLRGAPTRGVLRGWVIALAKRF